jgi:hypothetical protein
MIHLLAAEVALWAGLRSLSGGSLYNALLPIAVLSVLHFGYPFYS